MIIPKKHCHTHQKSSPKLLPQVGQSHSKEKWLDSAGSQYSNSMAKSVPQWRIADVEIHGLRKWSTNPRRGFSISLLIYWRANHFIVFVSFKSIYTIIYIYILYNYIYTIYKHMISRAAWTEHLHLGIKTTRILKVCSLNQLIKMFVDSRMLMFADLHGLAPFLFFAWQRLCIRIHKRGWVKTCGTIFWGWWGWWTSSELSSILMWTEDLGSTDPIQYLVYVGWVFNAVMFPLLLVVFVAIRAKLWSL